MVTPSAESLELKDLKELFRQVLKTELEDLITNQKPQNLNEYLTRKEVAQMLKIDLSSVHNWSKRGILKPYKLGNRVYFKLEELQNSFVEFKTNNNE